MTMDNISECGSLIIYKETDDQAPVEVAYLETIRAAEKTAKDQVQNARQRKSR